MFQTTDLCHLFLVMFFIDLEKERFKNLEVGAILDPVHIRLVLMYQKCHGFSKLGFENSHGVQLFYNCVKIASTMFLTFCCAKCFAFLVVMLPHHIL